MNASVSTRVRAFICKGHTNIPCICLPFELTLIAQCVCAYEGFAAGAPVSSQMNGHNKAAGSNEQVHLCLWTPETDAGDTDNATEVRWNGRKACFSGSGGSLVELNCRLWAHDSALTMPPSGLFIHLKPICYRIVLTLKCSAFTSLSQIKSTASQN